MNKRSNLLLIGLLVFFSNGFLFSEPIDKKALAQEAITFFKEFEIDTDPLNYQFGNGKCYENLIKRIIEKYKTDQNITSDLVASCTLIQLLISWMEKGLVDRDLGVIRQGYSSIDFLDTFSGMLLWYAIIDVTLLWIENLYNCIHNDKISSEEFNVYIDSLINSEEFEILINFLVSLPGANDFKFYLDGSEFNFDKKTISMIFKDTEKIKIFLKNCQQDFLEVSENYKHASTVCYGCSTWSIFAFPNKIRNLHIVAEFKIPKIIAAL